jgi:gluconokinase
MFDKLFMGIDIGTSGVRAALFDEVGNQVSLNHKEYPMICTEPGMAELDPELVFSSLIEVVRGCNDNIKGRTAYIKAIGLSTQLHSIMAVDKYGTPLTNLITWADTRCMAQGDYIRDNFNNSDLYYRTGCRTQHPMYPLSKILWIKDTKPHIFTNTHKFVSIKEFILNKLFKRYIIDITDASSSALFNIHNFQWDDHVLNNILEIDVNKFGEPVDCTYVLNNMDKTYVELMGIKPETPVTVGSGDGMLANVGCGVFDDSSMSFTIGTSGALRISVNEPLLDEKGRTWCYCFTKDTWVSGGAINNGGIVLRWLRDSFKKQYEYDAIMEEQRSIYDLFSKYASEIKPGSEGLIFLPYLTGERSPGWNAGARGTLHGLQLIHGKKHIIRAAMEGVMYKMYSIFEILTQINNNVKVIIGNGGYVNSNVWLQIQADLFNKEIAIAGIGEAAAFGAAYTAMAAIGHIENLKTPMQSMKPSRIITPIAENHQIYQEVYNEFKSLYKQFYGISEFKNIRVKEIV